jgi:hypothetical protein
MFPECSLNIPFQVAWAEMAAAEEDKKRREKTAESARIFAQEMERYKSGK